MNPQARAFLDRLRVGVSNTLDLSSMSKWLEKNTSNPKDKNLPWSFKHHEFQRDIIDDSANQLVVRKCSQVGLSELTVRLAAAFLALKQGYTAIYTLPTAGFATKFAKGRIHPVIKNSKTLSSIVDPDVFSTSLIQLGDSFWYIGGTFNDSSAISVPADMLIHDEVDFSNADVLTAYSSRLGHAENGGIKRLFSTPTVNNYGISKEFDLSTKHVRMVKCDSCHAWVAPDFFSDLLISGFEGSIIELDADDVRSGVVDPNGANLHCPKCKGVITVENLADPEKRQWVAEHPDREIHGYQVFPWDVPVYNPPSKTVAQITDYKRKADWVNFKIGLPYEDSQTSVMRSALERAFVLPLENPRNPQVSGTVIGVDVGKTSWLVAGKRVSPKEFKVFYYERIRQDGDNYLVQRILELINAFKAIKVVVDAAPDFSTAMALVNRTYSGLVYGNYYTNTASKLMTNVTVKEEAHVVSSFRTGTLSDMVHKVNSGEVLFANGPERKTMEEHLRALKKIRRDSSNGEAVEAWVSSGPDHYGHALNYALIADELVSSHAGAGEIPALPLPSKVRLKWYDDENPSMSELLSGYS